MKKVILAQYIFTLYTDWKKKYIEATIPPYDMTDKKWIVALMDDMDNIYSRCKDTFDEWKEILSKDFE